MGENGCKYGSRRVEAVNNINDQTISSMSTEIETRTDDVTSTPDVEQQFAELEKYVVRIDESILDEKQKKEWPGIRVEIVRIVHATATYKKLKADLIKVKEKLTKNFSPDRMTWHERDFALTEGNNRQKNSVNWAFNRIFHHVPNLIQGCIEGCERFIERDRLADSQSWGGRVRRLLGRGEDMGCLLAELKRVSEEA